MKNYTLLNLIFLLLFVLSGCSGMGPYAGEQKTKFPQDIDVITCQLGHIESNGNSKILSTAKWKFYPHKNLVIHTEKNPLEWREDQKNGSSAESVGKLIAKGALPAFSNIE